MIFFHGWQQSPDTTPSQTLINAYIANGTFNILALDWREAASNLILDVVVQRTEQVSEWN